MEAEVQAVAKKEVLLTLTVLARRLAFAVFIPGGRDYARN